MSELRAAAQELVSLYDIEFPYVGGQRQEAFQRATDRLRAALATADDRLDADAARLAERMEQAFVQGAERRPECQD